jgi:hypothetical protein
MSKSEKQVGEMTSWEFAPTTQQDHPLTIVFRELSECEFPEERSLYLRNHVPFVADIDKIEQYLRDNLVLFTTAQIALYAQYLAEHREYLQQASDHNGRIGLGQAPRSPLGQSVSRPP